MVFNIQKAIQHLIPSSMHEKEIYPTSGLYHFQLETGDTKSRVHLRLDDDGHGTMIINANQIYHLNPSAAILSYLSLKGVSAYSAAKLLKTRFNISKKQAIQDFETIAAQIYELTRPDAPCPICKLGLETTAPFSSQPTAPYRMDLAITYRCNNECLHCYTARPRNYPELNTITWQNILDSLWNLSIPHIVFTGGEPTLRPDLPDLITHAETNGQITGLNTNGRRLKNKIYVDQLISAGLDHVQITLESHDPEIHNKMVSSVGAWEETVAGIRNAINSKLYIMTNTTMLRENAAHLQDTLSFLTDLGVPTIGLNGLIYSGHGQSVGSGLYEEELPRLLDIARNHTQKYGQRLIWYTPTQYCHFDPVQMELGVKGCTAALYNMCIEPDGSVIPCQSYYQTLGNILDDSWDSIWNHDLAIGLRERKSIPKECQDCLLLAECSGGCPLARHTQNPIPITL